MTSGTGLIKTEAAVPCILYLHNMQYNAAQDVYGNVKGNWLFNEILQCWNKSQLPTWCKYLFILARHVSGLYAHLQEQ